MEIKLIAELKTQDPEYGYNISAGGDGVTGWHPSEETRKKMSQAAKKRVGEKNPNYGHKWSDEMKLKASKRNSLVSEETRKKISIAASKRVGDKNPFFGKRHTDETKNKIAMSRWQPVEMFDESQNLTRQFKSILEASKQVGVHKTSISNCCRGKTRTAGGYKWRYIQ